jgi:tetratricopeptide (TPR) repeat protein
VIGWILLSTRKTICLAFCLNVFFELSLTITPVNAIKNSDLKEYYRAGTLYKEGKYDQALKILVPIVKIETCPSLKSEQLNYITTSCMRLSRYAEAIKYLDQAIPLHQDLMKTVEAQRYGYTQQYLTDLVHKAKCQFYLHDFEASDRTLQQALKANRESESALYDRVLVLTELHRNQELADDITKLLAVLNGKKKVKDGPGHILTSQARRIEVLYKRSKAYAALGQTALALKDKQEADKLTEEY